MKPPLIVLGGPTAVGKTKLSLSLARAVNGEIISADSMQVYRHMDIGSAKIRPEEMEGIPHHLIDVLEPEEEFHIVKFQEMAKEAIDDILSRERIPILTGGTGFYIQAVTRAVDFAASHSEETYRRSLEEKVQREGPEVLHRMLEEVDAVSAAKIHPNNVKRMIRALEFYHENQRPISQHNEQQHNKPSPYRLAYFVLNDKRERLYQRINRRVDEMLTDGLIEEVAALKERGCTRQMVSMQGLGYKEIFGYLEGDYTLGEAIEILKRDTRHLAKRQITWFKREEEAIWLSKDDYDYDEGRILEAMLAQCKEKGILL